MGLFFLPQIAQMDTDLYSLNTNTCIIRENRELQISDRRESQIRVEINNPQNSGGIKSVFIRAIRRILIRWQRYKNDKNSGLNMFRPFSQMYILF